MNSMNIKTFIFNPICVNTYVVWDDSNECIFVDAGSCTDKENERLAEFISEKKLKPVALVNTHGHFDHTAGNEFLCVRYNINAYLHADDFHTIKMASAHAEHFDVHIKNPPTPKELGAEVKFGNTTLQVLHTPGHSKGSVSLYAKNEGVVFTGDTLFRGSIGRSDFEGGDLNELMNSLHLI
ncbi:MAG: MBL fold metallo-hydrolase, partial [Prevotellaceae bacterium]|nr:MBL fold metallo-hydrolase [Prevotellaceae bacterium]